MMTEFQIGPYKFMHGPSVRDGETTFAPRIHGFCAWMWNGYYWQIEIADAAADLESVKYALQFVVADRKEGLLKP